MQIGFATGARKQLGLDGQRMQKVIQPEQFFRLLDFDADFVAAVYPDRRARDAVLQALYEADGTKPGSRSIQDISASAMKYLMTIYTKKSKPIDVKRKMGFIRLHPLPGAFPL